VRARCAPWSEVIELGYEQLPPLKRGEALVRVEAGRTESRRNADSLRNYAVRLPFPYPIGGEGRRRGGDGTDVSLSVGARYAGHGARIVRNPCHGAGLLFRTYPKRLTFEDGACLAVAALTAGGLARCLALQGHPA